MSLSAAFVVVAELIIELVALFRIKNLSTREDFPDDEFPMTAILQMWTGCGGGGGGGGGGVGSERVEPGRTRILDVAWWPSVIIVESNNRYRTMIENASKIDGAGHACSPQENESNSNNIFEGAIA